MSEAQDIPAAMKHALRRFAKSVSIVTSNHDGEDYAMAATAVCELCLDPPTIMVCINRAAAFHRSMDIADHFCINVLDVAQQDVSIACGGQLQGEDKFSVGRWEVHGRTGLRYLPDALSSFICRKQQAMVWGTHTMFVGIVEEVFEHESSDPLVYLDGSYFACKSLEIED